MAAVQQRRAMQTLSAQHDPHEVGRIFGAELFHDSRAVHLDRARADGKLPAGLLNSSTSHSRPVSRS